VVPRGLKSGVTEKGFGLKPGREDVSGDTPRTEVRGN
jgi:hypothetical protein